MYHDLRLRSVEREIHLGIAEQLWLRLSFGQTFLGSDRGILNQRARKIASVDLSVSSRKLHHLRIIFPEEILAFFRQFLEKHTLLIFD